MKEDDFHVEKSLQNLLSSKMSKTVGKRQRFDFQQTLMLVQL